ncbi:MAG: EFR1 family ferrodoxin [Prevotella sp.]|nr:EFR1 family ferrodoxin [Prevotella sp.]
MIFYFSGTGNTKWAAQQLSTLTNEPLVSIAEAVKAESYDYSLKTAERLGFCFPVHGWQPPRIVRQFVDRLNIGDTTSHYCYALCTCGDSIGMAMDMIEAELRNRGIRLASAVSLVMPESYVCLPFMYTDTPERERAKLQQAEADLDAFATKVIERKEGYRQLKEGAAPWLMSHVIGAYFNGRMITDRKFRVDPDRCVGCGLCEKMCPTGDVRLDGQSHPEWQHSGACTCCLACYHHCPHHAIDYGRYTPRRGQYYYGHGKKT